LAPELLALVVDPVDHQELYYFADEAFLYNPRSRRRYPVVEPGIPVLLADEGEVVDDDEHRRLTEEIGTRGVAATGSKGADD